MSGSGRRGKETRQTPWGLRPSDWELVPWSAFAARSGRPVVVEPDANLKQVTVRVRHQGVTERRLNKNRPRRIGTPNQVQVSAGQFVISKIDARNGACGLIPDDLDGAIVTQDFPVYDIHAADPSYLDHLVDLPVFWRLCESVSDGTTNRVRLDLEQFDELRFPMPPLPEQRRIAAVLDAIDEAIERSQAVVAATEGLRRSLLHELLSEGLPGRHTAWREVAGVGRVPSEWEVVRLGEVAEVRSGQADPRDAAFQDLRFIAPDDVESVTGRLIRERTVADVGAISGKYEFDQHDVIYSKIRPCLMKVHLPAERGLCSADMYPLRPGRSLNRTYLALVLLSRGFTSYARTCSDRTGIPKINRRDLLRFRFPLPPLEEQEMIGSTLAGVDAAIAQGRSETDVLRSLAESAAEALLSGRVRTRESQVGRDVLSRDH